MLESLTWPELLGGLATACTAPSLLPQLWKTWRTRSARDLSALWLAMSLLGTLSWSLYGLLLPAPEVMWANLVIFLLLLGLQLMKWRFD
ncbi:MAG: PQ-loop repeat-containing protein [Magnetococcales bacterium]|nr:PQ-loop repeat-containing protein [Magnetococcales bacterium]